MIKKVLKKAFFLPLPILFILVPVATVLLVYALAYEGADPVLTYLSYLLSAYALAIVCARIPSLYRTGKAWQQKNPYLSRYTGDAGLRVMVSLRVSLTVNLLYALMQLWLGLTNRSVWFYTLAGYYVLLFAIRCLLLRELREESSRDKARRACRSCGILLVAMNLTLGAVTFYIVWQNRGFEHHYIVTIGMAAYTFYAFTMAIVNLVKYRKYKNPLFSAAKVTGFAAALVSMLSLETAMLSAFGDAGQEAFRQTVTAWTGGVVCVAVLLMGGYMIFQSVVYK